MRHRYRVFLHSSIYGTLRSTPPTVDELSNLFTQFNTKEIDEKFFEEDVVKVRTGGDMLPSPTAASAAAGGGKSTPPGPAPAPPPPPPKASAAPTQPKYVVAFEYNPAVVEEGMMSIFVGEILIITDKSDADWWMATNIATGKSGWIPAAYVKLQEE